MFQKMVVAVDGSNQSLRAAEQAIFLAEKCSAHVYVVYVAERIGLKAEVIDSWDLYGITEQRKRRVRLIEKQARNKGISYEVKILRGEPASTIIRFAEEEYADLIVIGSRGLNQFQQLIIGSVSHKVMKKAKCSIMLIK
ncbi:universal stress protein [Halalkalibacter krulwichiae]|uniref:Universal stress protein n=1 Tax=Halalkalibacter krulwichiae TaxID=199441 RepID=A0A1Y9THF6_9BACI|nr:universal stress protein [Halalkalibacter krulwichiae]ARK28598.1 Putative universal stress protein [Halalkalibacter krulwichiae]